MNDVLEKVKSFLFAKKRAYEIVFDRENVFVKTVLKDMAKFCRADETAFHPDPRIHAVLEGRREVWLRIQKYLKLTPDELWELQRKEHLYE